MKKTNEELALTYVFRPIAKSIVPYLAKLRVLPNTVTMWSFNIGMLGIILLGIWHLYTIAAILIFMSFVLDCADGQLARHISYVTKAGDFLDDTLDRVLDIFIMFGLFMVVGTRGSFAWATFAIIGVLMTFIIGMSMKKPGEKFGKAKNKVVKGLPNWMIFGRGARTLFIVVFLLLHQPLFILMMFAVVMNIYWIVGAIHVYKRLSDKKGDFDQVGGFSNY